MTTNEIIPVQPLQIVTTDARSLECNPAAVYLASLSESSRRPMRQALDNLAERLTGSPDAFGCDWAGLRYQHVNALRSWLAEKYKTATANRVLAALRGTLKSAWRLELITAEEYERAVDFKPVRGSSVPAGRELASGEMAALMANCEADATPAGRRDAALIAVGYSSGLRRAELVELDLADLEPNSGKLLVRKGKGNKERVVYLTDGALDALNDWLALRGAEPGPLFLPIRKGGAAVNRRMAPQSVYDILARRGGLAGVRAFSPHDLRRSFVSDLLEAGADIATVAKLAGHSSVDTTARYDRRPEEAKQKAVGLLHVPYRRKG